MNEQQKETATAGVMAYRYTRIAAVFDTMPDRFKMLDLMDAAGIKDAMQVRAAVSTILFRDFKCIQVGTSANRVWRTP